jgi:dihydrofolate reductase
VFLSGDIAEQVAQIKQQPGPDLHVWGSGHLLQTLIQHDLVDMFWLMIYPITLGSGKRLFASSFQLGTGLRVFNAWSPNSGNR